MSSTRCARSLARPSLRRLAFAAVLLAACGSTVTSGGPPTAAAARSGTVPPTRSPLATASGTAIVTAPERDAWARIRAALPPGSPVGAPTWLPAVLDRDHVAIGDLRAEPADPRYVVTYSGAGRAIDFGMGGSGPVPGQSGLGTRVRRSITDSSSVNGGIQ